MKKITSSTSTVPQLVDAYALARMLACSPSHVFALAAANKIPSYQLGRAIRFDPQAVLDALRRAS